MITREYFGKVKFYDLDSNTIYYGSYVSKRNNKKYEYIFRGGKLTEERYILVHDKRLTNSYANSSSSVKQCEFRLATPKEEAILRESLKAGRYVDKFTEEVTVVCTNSNISEFKVGSNYRAEKLNDSYLRINGNDYTFKGRKLSFEVTLEKDDLVKGDYYKFNTRHGSYVILQWGGKGVVQQHIDGSHNYVYKESRVANRDYWYIVKPATLEEIETLVQSRNAGEYVGYKKTASASEFLDSGNTCPEINVANSDFADSGSEIYVGSKIDHHPTYSSTRFKDSGVHSIAIGKDAFIHIDAIKDDSITLDYLAKNIVEPETRFKEIPFNNPRRVVNKEVEKVSMGVTKVKIINF